MNEIDRRFLLGGLAGAAGVSAFSAMAKAGPLNPPAGAVGSSGKTLTDVEPRTAINATNTPGDANSVFRIAQAGSYYLAANVLIPANKTGIEIAASGVTVDLNGFVLTSFGGLQGIVASSTSIERITVRNGRILGGTGGVDLAGINDVTVESVAAEVATGPGIRTGARAAVVNCSAISNTTSGITVGEQSHVERCTAASTAGTGIEAAAGSRIVDCVSQGNTSRGYTLNACETSGCVARQNSTGFYINGGVASACLAADNSASGFLLGDRAMITDSVADGNGGSGISAPGECTIRRNTCIENAFNATNAAGIYVNAGGTLVEGNHCVGNNRGYLFVFSGSTLIGNTARLNTLVNWDIAVGNYALVVAAATSAAFSGDSGGTSLGSTNPYANFTL
jgi:hypothetical protein